MIEKKIYPAAMMLAVLMYCWSLIHFSLNLPKGDDYFDVLRFLNEYNAAGGWDEKFRLIFSNNNEHKTALAHLVYLVFYHMLGQIDFRLLMFFGNLGMLGMVALFAWHWKDAPGPSVGALAAVYLLNFQSWDSMFWAMASISNFWVLFLGFLSISCLFHRASWAFSLACLAAVLATFSQGNGLLVWPLGALCLFYRHGFRRGGRQLALWCLLAVAIIAFYFWGFPEGYDNAQDTVFAGITTHTGLLRAVVWFLSFLGSGLLFDSQVIAFAVICGSLVLLFSAWSFYFFLKRKPAIACIILFLLLSVLMATVSRYSLFELTFALASRYKIYSNCLVAIFLFALLLRSRETHFGPMLQAGLMAFAIVHGSASYVSGISALQRDQFGRVDALQRWFLTQNKMHFDLIMRSDSVRQLRTAVEAKVWSPRDVFPDLLVFSRKRSAAPCSTLQVTGIIPSALRRTPGALVGELQFTDNRLRFDRISSIEICSGERIYMAPLSSAVRRHDGILIVHYLAADNVESGKTLLVQTIAGEYFRADFSGEVFGG